MRRIALSCALLLASCADPTDKPKVIVKKILVPGPEKIVHVPGPERIREVQVPIYVTSCPPAGYCNAITDEAKCRSEQRCHWYAGEVKRHHCRQIQCKP